MNPKPITILAFSLYVLAGSFLALCVLGVAIETGLLDSPYCGRPHADVQHDNEHCVSPAPYIGVEDGVVVPRSIRRVR